MDDFRSRKNRHDRIGHPETEVRVEVDLKGLRYPLFHLPGEVARGLGGEYAKGLAK